MDYQDINPKTCSSRDTTWKVLEWMKMILLYASLEFVVLPWVTNPTRVACSSYLVLLNGIESMSSSRYVYWSYEWISNFRKSLRNHIVYGCYFWYATSWLWLFQCQGLISVFFFYWWRIHKYNIVNSNIVRQIRTLCSMESFHLILLCRSNTCITYIVNLNNSTWYQI